MKATLTAKFKKLSLWPTNKAPKYFRLEINKKVIRLGHPTLTAKFKKLTEYVGSPSESRY